jgi:hypothetical protein
MRERKRKHDDAHRPMGGRGKQATPPIAMLVMPKLCEELSMHRGMIDSRDYEGSNADSPDDIASDR